MAEVLFTEVVGPDIVKVTFNSKVSQYDTLGTSVTGMDSIEIYTIHNNTIYYKVLPPFESTDTDIYFDYANGNLISLPNQQPVANFTKLITNTIKKDYIGLLDDELLSGLDNSYFSYYVKQPHGVLANIDDNTIVNLDSEYISIDAGDDNYLQDAVTNFIFTTSGENIIIGAMGTILNSNYILDPQDLLPILDPFDSSYIVEP